MTRLVRGQRVRLGDLGASGPLELRLETPGPQELPLLLALQLGIDGRLSDDRFAVGPGQSVPAGLLRVTRQGFEIDCETLPTSARVVLALGFRGDHPHMPGHASQIRGGTLRLVAQGRVLAQLDLEGQDFDSERAVLLGEFYHKDVWRFSVGGGGFYGGLPALLSHYGASPDLEARLFVSAPPAAPASREETAPVASLDLARPVWLPAQWPGGSAPRLPAGVLPAVGSLRVRLEDGEASGTAFCISPGGHLLTCQHVVEGARELEFQAEGSAQPRPVRVLAEDEERDVALLLLADGAGSPYWLPLDATEQAPALGDELGLLGYPLGQHLGEGITYSQGIVNGLRARDGTPYLQIDTGAAPGSSGGPVFRRLDGRVVGMLQGGLAGAQGMIINIALDLRALGTLGWIRRAAL
ncbi:hypothetical protein HNR42_001019 [Deinobacterium chartae]|uniref:TerD domain-containing protein n=1 Tax=Deinobacterium chartae TaxID=521158 RepID=A0A841I0G3_9DEIO|nr:trypsin-like peptidase domain-containing protein [Deinobacterium chartae]MBB6097602.1 hypothetical protein [Deinobacterium chartae]